ncbi:MAG: hypothetical protein JO264_02945 [Acidisphaera sp.]|nr:hypothetical protein [Acidisphaera sp.]
MRKTILVAATVLALGAAATAGSLIRTSWAQGAAAPGAAPPPPPWMQEMRDRMRDRMPPWAAQRPWMRGGHEEHGHMLFALLYRPEDRALAAPDVQKIAEAFLLWNGNHTWKVTEVAEAPDNTVTFAFATQSGDVIARFAMDRKTGHVRRVG